MSHAGSNGDCRSPSSLLEVKQLPGENPSLFNSSDHIANFNQKPMPVNCIICELHLNKAIFLSVPEMDGERG